MVRARGEGLLVAKKFSSSPEYNGYVAGGCWCMMVLVFLCLSPDGFMRQAQIIQSNGARITLTRQPEASASYKGFPPADNDALSPLANCSEPLSPYNVDCFLLHGERADPYLLRRQWEHGIISRDSANCHAENLPGRDSRVLLDNIQLQATEQLEAGVTAGRDNIRILCIVVTDSSKHGNNLQAVRTTWGRRCTGFVAFSNRTDLELSAVETPAYGRVGDSNTWQKTRTMYKYILHRYLTEFDWFLRADDDTYIIWENLVHFLERKTIQDAQDSEEGLYMGRRFLLNGNKDDLYVSGGAGAVMDRAALRKLASHLDHPNCDPAGQHDFDDFFVGRCLAAAGVKPIDTRDERRRERFNPFQPWNHLRYKGGDWYQQYSPDGVQYGLDCCSQRSISFHFLPEKDMLATHRYLHDCRMAMTDI